MSSSNCCFLACIQISQEASQVVQYSHLFQNFPQLIVIHIVKGFGIVNKAEIDVFLELSCFFHDPADVGFYFSICKNIYHSIKKCISIRVKIIEIFWNICFILISFEIRCSNSIAIQLVSMLLYQVNFLIFYFKILLICFVVALGLCCCLCSFSSCVEQGLLFVAARRFPVALASPGAVHRLQGVSFSRCSV